MWTLPEWILESIAEQCLAEGSLQTVFYSGAVKTPEQFVKRMQEPANLPLFVFSGKEPIGFGWLNGVAGGHAFAHFCFLKRAWGGDSYRAGRLALKYWLSFPTIHVLLGVIPEANEHAIHYAVRQGFVRVGSIPKMVVNPAGDREAAAILYYTGE